MEEPQPLQQRLSASFLGEMPPATPVHHVDPNTRLSSQGGPQQGQQQDTLRMSRGPIPSSAAANPEGLEEEHPAVALGLVPLYVAVHRTMDACEQRCLHPTSQWLAALLLAATPEVMEEPAYPAAPLWHGGSMSGGASPSVSGISPIHPSVSPSANHLPSVHADPAVANYDADAMPHNFTHVTAKTLAGMGRSLLMNREYLRCHDLLRSVALPAPAIPVASEVGAAAGAGGQSEGGVGSEGMTAGGQADIRSLSSIRPCDWSSVEDSVARTNSEPVEHHNAGGRSHSIPAAAVFAPPPPLATHGGATVTRAWQTRSSASASVGPHRAGSSSPMPPPIARELTAAAVGADDDAKASAKARGSCDPRVPVGDVQLTTPPHMESPLLSFLALYALYMEGQRHATVSASSTSTIASRANPNPNLRALRSLLAATLAYYPEDGYLLWLHGVVLRESKLHQEAAIELLHAVRVEPFLWCAWVDLATLVTRESQVEDIRHTPLLRFHQRADVQLMFRFFSATVREDLQHYNTALGEWESLLGWFPGSSLIRCRMGSCLYQKKELDRARALFEDVRTTDPFRLEGMDDFSNVLFVRGDRVALSSLAQSCYGVDPYRAESNCIVGNYFAIVGRHEKSLIHFRRAVAIDPKYLSGWTLMGHEYLELKNTAAAVEAYRAAVEIDQRDYRAWYALGQIYELLQMHHHSLYYYWHTTLLRPNDPRMWTAVANCLEMAQRHSEAIACLERAELFEPTISEQYPELVRRIADFHHLQGNTDQAVIYYEKLVQSEQRKPQMLVQALPTLISAHLAHVHEAMDIPNRSPSFDIQHHFMHARGASVGRGGSASQGRPSVELRKQASLETLDRCNALVNLLCFALAAEDGSGAVEGAAVASMGLSNGASPEQFIAQLRSDIRYARDFVTTQYKGK